jgi:tetratricopeptide (TPR) repeat protein
VESVAWISEQKSTLSAVFYLGSALAYLHFNQTRRRSQYYLALGLFVLALLSKTVTATLPAVLLVVLWWRDGRLEWKRDVRALTGWMVLGASAGIFTAWVERTLIGAQGADFALTALQRILVAGRVVWFYAGKVVWPANLIFNYPRWNIDAGQWRQYMFPLALVALLAAFCLLARRRRGPLASLLIFGGTLFPVLGFLNVYPFRYSYVADHFQYLASLAIIVPVSSALAKAARRLSLPKVGSAALGALLVLGLGGLTWRQAHAYKDSETLYRETLARNPESYLARTNLCILLLQNPDRLADAEAPCEEGVLYNPNVPEAHEALGLLRSRTPERMPEAIAEFEAALRLRPEYATAHMDLGNALAQTPGRQADAIAEFDAALRICRACVPAYLGIGNTLLEMPGRQQDALTAYQSALRIWPASAEAHFDLGSALLQMPGRKIDAIAEFQTALQDQPDFEPAKRELEQLESGR